MSPDYYEPSFYERVVNHPLFPRPKVLAGVIVGLLVYVLGAFGLDLGVVLQDVGEVVGVDLPDQQALTVLLAAAIAAYTKKDTR